MKEVTYGWYPSKEDVYRSKGRPSSYHLECLYKYKDSLYYQGQVQPPQSELIIRGVSPRPEMTPQEIRRQKAKSVMVPKFSPVPKLNIPTPTQCWAASTQKGTSETAWGVVGELPAQTIPTPPDVSWPLPKSKKQQLQQQPKKQQQRLSMQYSPQQQTLKERIQSQQEKYFGQRHQSPQLAWGFRKAQTARDTMSARPLHTGSDELKWPKAQDVRPQPRPHSSSTVQTPKSPKQSHKTRPSSSPVRSPSQSQCQGQGQRVQSQTQATPIPPQVCKTPGSGRPSRIQSATIRRDKTPLPTRPMTATSPRKQSTTPDVRGTLEKEPANERPESRPQAPVPFIYDVNDAPDLAPDDLMDDDEDLRGQDSILDDPYDDIVKKYGWRAEVHGDPYKLKRTMPRMSYAVTCPIPEVPPEPPGIHMETNEPFFYNTIPNKPMVFAVDKEWMSEVLLAKRLELQKREGGIKYSYKNFSFVY